MPLCYLQYTIKVPHSSLSLNTPLFRRMFVGIDYRGAWDPRSSSHEAILSLSTGQSTTTSGQHRGNQREYWNDFNQYTKHRRYNHQVIRLSLQTNNPLLQQHIIKQHVIRPRTRTWGFVALCRPICQERHEPRLPSLFYAIISTRTPIRRGYPSISSFPLPSTRYRIHPPSSCCCCFRFRFRFRTRYKPSFGRVEGWGETTTFFSITRIES